jgi:hypothetical protein
MANAEAIQGIGMLAHLRNRFMVGPENLATESLAYILNHHKEASKAFQDHARAFCPAHETNCPVTNGIFDSAFVIAKERLYTS